MPHTGKRAFGLSAGCACGRPRALEWEKVVALRAAGKSLKEVAALMHCSIGTVCRIAGARRGSDGGRRRSRKGAV